jgi:methyltransferase (TIGR00027 family)
VVFEIDHPATQAFKRARVAALSPTAREVRFGAIDFQTDSLESCLAGAGQRPDVGTLWIWEGVVMYLRREVVQTTLRTVSKRSAFGSRLVISYITDNRAAGRRALRWVMRSLREPHVTSTSPGEIAQWLTAVGFRVISDSDAIDWARQFGGRVLLPRLMSSERVVIAENTSSDPL